MKQFMIKRIAPAVVAIGMTGGAFGLAATAASASTHAAVKSGAACTKSEVNKTTKSGKTELVCKKSGKKYKWETK